MKYYIKNSALQVCVDSLGAELQSIQSVLGTEYLWQADPKYWNEKAPNLFPYIGRMINKCYKYQGVTYPMQIHGFASSTQFTNISRSDSELVFAITETQQTKAQYPWAFRFEIKYTLSGNALNITYTVENKDSKTMLFGVGGHPGFRIPGEFTDYRLRFSPGTSPERIVFTDDCFTNGFTDYPLVDNTIPLCHSLFDDDAIVLKNSGNCVTLENTGGDYSVTVSYPQMPYIGFWHRPRTDAPYVCIEPWSSLPSPKGEKTVLETQQDLISLPSGETYTNTWTISICETR